MTRRWRALGLLAIPLLALLFRREPRPAPLPPIPAARLDAPVEDSASPTSAQAAARAEVEPKTESLSPTEPELPLDPNSWMRSPVVMGLVWLVRQQNEDGSWGNGPASLEGQPLGRPGITALALLSFLGAGYSQLSKDEYDGVKVGDAVRRALKWFLQEQSPEGHFGSGRDLDHMLATHAIAEAYGFTASGPLKEPTKKALDGIEQSQLPDGSWGTPAVTAWALHALASGILDELGVDREVQERALRYSIDSPHPGLLSGRIFMSRKNSGLDAEATALFRSPPARDDLAGWLHASMSLFLQQGEEGALWTHWKEPMMLAATAGRGPDGGWPGGNGSDRVVRTSLALNLLEIYYRYANIGGVASK